MKCHKSGCACMLNVLAFPFLLGLPQKKQCALWVHLVNIKLNLNALYTCNKGLVVTITTFKIMSVVMSYIICVLWPVNSGENTVSHMQ